MRCQVNALETRSVFLFLMMAWMESTGVEMGQKARKHISLNFPSLQHRRGVLVH